jgi:hypothetical protein
MLALLRIAGLLTAIAIGSGIVAYLFTRDRLYLRWAGRIAKGALIFVLIVLGLMVLQRVIAL